MPSPRRLRPLRSAVLVGLLAGLLPVCSTSPTAVELPPAEIRVLFVGNSLTYTHDLPAMVQTIAEAAGHTLARRTVAVGGYSLQEHWGSGIADEIRAAAADVVVLQQGPSSLPESRVHLLEWSGRIAEVVREEGGRPALLMVWPSEARSDAFPAVRESYRAAAQAVEGIFVPAGQAWLEAWSREPDLPLYGPDRFHPGELGTFLAALTVYRMLYGEPVTGLPHRLEPESPGLPVLEIPESAAPLLFGAVEDAVAEWGRVGRSGAAASPVWGASGPAADESALLRPAEPR